MIILRVFIGLDTQGTAQAIGIAPGTVGVHLHRALATLHAVTARDAAGDMITETLPAAYRIAPATGDRSTFPTTFSTTAKPPTPPATGTTDPLRNACPKPRPGRAQCFVRYQTRSRGTGVAATARPKGLTPRDIWSAYRLPFRRNLRQTVAIVDAFRTPHLRQYADHYRQQFGLPPCGGCLKIVNQRGHPARCLSQVRAPAGTGRRRWTWTSSRWPARAATSWWSRPVTTRSLTSLPARTLRPGSAHPSSRTATADRRTGLR